MKSCTAAVPLIAFVIAFAPPPAHGAHGMPKPGETSAKPDTIKEALNGAAAAFNTCYDAELKNNRTLEGALLLEVKVGRDGTLADAKIREDRLGSAVVAACVLTKAREIKWPAGAKDATVTRLLVFAPTRTLAVIPFDNMTADRSLDWLRGGLAEALVTKLGQVPKLVLVDRLKLDAVMGEQALGQSGAVSPESAAKTGKLAGAQIVVTGAFQRAGGNMKFTARVVDAETGKVRRTAEALGKAEQVFDLQAQLAAKLCEALHIGTTPEIEAALALRLGSSVPILETLGRATNALKGIGEHVDREKAAGLYRQVIAMDPKIPEAHFGLAMALWHAEDAEKKKLVEDELKKAVELRADYHEAVSLLGFSLWRANRIDEAFELQRRAVACKPDFAMGYYGLAIAYASKGKADEAFPMLERALALDPNDGEYRTQYGQLVAIFKKDYAAALKHTSAALGMKDAGEWSHLTHAYVRMTAGDPAGCLEHVLQGRKARGPNDPPRFVGQSLSLEAACMVKAGRMEEAKAVWAKVPDEGPKKMLSEGAIPIGTPVFVQTLFGDLRAALAPILPPPSSPPEKK